MAATLLIGLYISLSQFVSVYSFQFCKLAFKVLMQLSSSLSMGMNEVKVWYSGMTTNLIKPGYCSVTLVFERSQSILKGSPFYFSISPYWKNSSKR